MTARGGGREGTNTRAPRRALTPRVLCSRFWGHSGQGLTVSLVLALNLPSGRGWSRAFLLWPHIL